MLDADAFADLVEQFGCPHGAGLPHDAYTEQTYRCPSGLTLLRNQELESSLTKLEWGPHYAGRRIETRICNIGLTMTTDEFWKQAWLTILDKGLLAAILVGAGFYVNRVLEGIKNKLSREQEFSRTVNSAVVDLTKKLASGNHVSSWLSWSATQAENSLCDEDFAVYDKDMMAVLSDLVGLQASVAALDPEKFKVLSHFVRQLYDMDVEVGKARDLFRTRDPLKQARCIDILRLAHARSMEFEKALLASVTGLLSPPRTKDSHKRQHS